MNGMSRGTQVVVAVALALGGTLVACSPAEERSAPPAEPPSITPVPSRSPSPPATEPPGGWQPVATGGTIVDLSYAFGPPGAYALAAGEDGGRPLLVGVDRGVASMSAISFPDDWTALRTVESDGQTVALTAEADDGTTRLLTTDSGFYDLSFDDLPTGRDKAAPERLEPILDGEEDYRSFGVVRTAGHWEVRAWEAFKGWEQIGRGPYLRLTRPPGQASLHVGTQEVMVMVGGDVARGRGDAGPQLWWIASTLTGRERWQRLPLSPRPDEITDVSCWDIGCWVTASRRGRPVVYDFDTRSGAPLDAPDTRLDPDDPVVLMGRQPIGRTSMVLATASVEGNRLWVGRRRSPAWTEIEAPPGELTRVLVVRRQAYLLIDGQVWFRPLR